MSDERQLRVTVSEAWDTVTVTAGGDRPFGEIKAEALERALGRTVDPAGFVLKFRGALVDDERRSLDDLDVPDGAALIVLPARRAPVR